jgi:hypothetical protein
MDVRGNVWVLPDSSIVPARRWIVFSPDGHIIGARTLRADAIYTYADYRYLGEDHVLALAWDSLGIQRVVKYALRP